MFRENFHRDFARLKAIQSSHWPTRQGVHVYTGAFTTPTGPLAAVQSAGTNITAITGSQTSLLTCQSITLVDNSTNLIALTNTGPVTTTATQSPFTSTTVSIPTAALTSVRQQFTGDGSTTTFAVAGGYTPNAVSVFLNGVMLRNGTEVTVTSGASVVFATAPPSGTLIDVIGTVPTTYSSITPVSYSVTFSGSSNYLSVPNINFGTNNFTIEGWFYPTSVGSYVSFWGTDNASGANPKLALYVQSGGGNLYLDNGSGTIIMSVPTSNITTNAWNHIALVRAGTGTNQTTLYINGTPKSSNTLSTNLSSVTAPFNIGYVGEAGLNTFPGNISNFRVVNGAAVYTGTFTPPQTPLTAVQSASGSAIAAITGNQTVLLTCNAPTIVDGSNSPLTITNTGAATVSTAIVPTFTNVTITNLNALGLAGVQTSSFTASAGYIYPVNTSSGPVTVTLPASPVAGQQIAIFDYAGTSAANNITIYPNTNKFQGATSNIVMGTLRESAQLVYVDSIQGWCPYGTFAVNPFVSYSYTASYLIVAGGGGGGKDWSGGGGAGGLLTGTSTLTPGTSYTITVGAGGAGQTSINTSPGASGSSSSFSAVGTTALGGGGGGSGSVGAGATGANGGSGGGGGGSNSGVSGGTGTSGQGNNGGSVAVQNGGAGAGGGASAVGGNGASGTGGTGGVGTSSSITGSAVFYAGGGGGGGYSPSSVVAGAGGNGGGGAGNATSGGIGTAGTTNTGGGGGGGAGGSGNGGAGGSGVVIISIPAVNFSGITTGTVTTSGSNKIITFTSSGTFTG